MCYMYNDDNDCNDVCHISAYLLTLLQPTEVLAWDLRSTCMSGVVDVSVHYNLFSISFSKYLLMVFKVFCLL